MEMEFLNLKEPIERELPADTGASPPEYKSNHCCQGISNGIVAMSISLFS
jgi:hypothetical protein